MITILLFISNDKINAILAWYSQDCSELTFGNDAKGCFETTFLSPSIINTLCFLKDEEIKMLQMELQEKDNDAMSTSSYATEAVDRDRDKVAG